MTGHNNAGLFDGLDVRGVHLRNRIVMAPMCQYSTSGDGCATSWHLAHIGARAVGGVGLILMEATAVEPRGRISEGDLGLWNDAQVDPLRPIVEFCRQQGASIGIQIAHAGRKAGSRHKGHWDDESVAPSAVAFDHGWRVPHALAVSEITDIVQSFSVAARRAIAAGFEVVEIHGAHGYLVSSFLSPLANRRTDGYGGGISGRVRFGCEVVGAVRDEIPSDTPLLIRVSGSDIVAGGNTVEDMAVAAAALHSAGADVIDVSVGGNSPAAPVRSPNMVQLAEVIRERARVPTIAIGDIRDPHAADAIIRTGKADLVALARELLRSPYWPLAAAQDLGIEVPWPTQYESAKN